MNADAPWTSRWRLALTIALLLLAPASGGAQEQPVPRLEGRVTDVARVLSEADRERVSELLARYERETSHQIGVLLVPTLSGENIESFSLRVANSWKLGQKGLDNGILVTMAMKERAVRIELGAGMERFISNATAQSIINNSMVPAFRKGDYAGGLQAGLEQLMREGRRFVVTPAEPQRARKR
jgi:uncharacterized protein